MPIGNSGGGGGGVTFLSKTTLAVNGTFSLSSIPQGFSDLLLVGIVRGTNASVAEALLMTFNGDNTAGNYDSSTLNNANGTPGGNVVFGTIVGTRPAFSIPSANATANHFGVFETWIYGYASTVWRKAHQSTSWGDETANTTVSQNTTTGMWLSTAAITSIVIQGQFTSALLAASELRLYGRQ